MEVSDRRDMQNIKSCKKLPANWKTWKIPTKPSCKISTQCKNNSQTWEQRFNSILTNGSYNYKRYFRFQYLKNIRFRAQAFHFSFINLCFLLWQNVWQFFESPISTYLLTFFPYKAFQGSQSKITINKPWIEYFVLIAKFWLHRLIRKVHGEHSINRGKFL